MKKLVKKRRAAAGETHTRTLIKHLPFSVFYTVWSMTRAYSLFLTLEAQRGKGLIAL